MIIKNETSIKYFYILPFSEETRSKPFISTFFFLIYLVGVLVNSSIITAIFLDVQLHKPMYLFICNLSIVDIFSISVTVPKLLYMLLSGNHVVPFSQCYAQFYFSFTVLTAEDILLLIMAYDRYVAICLPLHYHRIMNQRNCILITIGIWAVAFSNCITFVTSALYMSSCHSNIIHQFFCDVKSLTRTTCTGSGMLFVVMSIEILIFGIVPVMCTIISYVNIFSVIFKMKSRESKRKAFSTCSSHITIIAIYYGTGMLDYVIPPYSEVLDLVSSIAYATIVPVINPIIYSLQNSNVKTAVLGLVKGMFCQRAFPGICSSRN